MRRERDEGIEKNRGERGIVTDHISRGEQKMFLL
jgi:hypothetical protein